MGEIELPNPHELEEIRQKGFTKRVTLVTAIFAVVLAIATLGKNYTMPGNDSGSNPARQGKVNEAGR
jgi:hypothetical protein